MSVKFDPILGKLRESDSASGGNAPADAKYIVQTADGDLANAQDLGSLATGIVKNTTTTGVLSIAVEGTDYYGPGGTDVAISDGGTGASTAADARTNLGLGTIATQDADNVAITGGSITGITDLAVADGGTGASTAGDARTNLGLVIGTNVQAHGDVLDDLNTLGAVANDGEFIVGTGPGAFAYESGATVRTSLGLTIGTDVQAWDAILDDLSGLTQATNKVPYFDSATTAATLDFLDEDDMASDSATGVASQQSIKAYVDNQTTDVGYATTFLLMGA